MRERGRSTRFPVRALGEPEAPEGQKAPVMLDGMEVLFDETVGLYPVELESTDSEGANGRRAGD